LTIQPGPRPVVKNNTGGALPWEFCMGIGIHINSN